MKRFMAYLRTVLLNEYDIRTNGDLVASAYNAMKLDISQFILPLDFKSKLYIRR